eukprot:gene1526-1497_t
MPLAVRSSVGGSRTSELADGIKTETFVEAMRPGAILRTYVDVLDERKLVAASPDRSVPNRRWRVRDNLPGTPAFCPLVRKTSELDAAAAVDIRGLLDELASEFGEDVQIKSSFAMEGEADQSDRIQRFADVLARRMGQGDLALNDPVLA